MTRKKRTSEEARRQVGQLLTAFAWDRARRLEWLKEHSQLSPKDLLHAAEVAVGKDASIWGKLKSMRATKESD